MKSATMDRKTLAFYLATVFVAFDVAAAFYLKDRLGPITFAGRNVRFSVLVYNSVPGPEGEQEFARLTCGAPWCANRDLKDLLEREYKRASGKETKILFDIRKGPNDGIFTKSPEDGIGNVGKMLWQLRNEFTASGLPFLRTEARLVVRIVNKPRDDRSESSIGSAQLRLGLIEWRIATTQSDYLWNITKSAHEIGHIFGASDKFDAQGNTVVPAGLVEPSRGKDQRYVEIMSGTRPTIEGSEAEPKHLNELAFGAVSQQEMHWMKL